MTKATIAGASSTLYQLLEPFTSEERRRIVQATMLLLGDSAVALSNGGPGTGTPANTGGGAQFGSGGPKSYFESKAPTKKIEELAVAARFLENSSKGDAHTSEAIKGVFVVARRNFDGGNFVRDINNARTAGLFNKGGNAKTGFTLSYYGQNYVDVLPDRAKLKELKRPKKGASRKKSAGKTSVAKKK